VAAEISETPEIVGNSVAEIALIFGAEYSIIARVASLVLNCVEATQPEAPGKSAGMLVPLESTTPPLISTSVINLFKFPLKILLVEEFESLTATHFQVELSTSIPEYICPTNREGNVSTTGVGTGIGALVGVWLGNFTVPSTTSESKSLDER
jgi:hypothetical protein